MGRCGARRCSASAGARPPRCGARRPPPRVVQVLRGTGAPGCPRRPPAPALQAPHPPRRSRGAGQRRPPAQRPSRPSSRPPRGRSPSELASSYPEPLHHPLPTSRDGVGRGAPGGGSRPPPAPRRPGGWAGKRLRGGCRRLGPGLTGRDRWALLRGTARSLREERRPREGLEESAACTATAALIPGAGRREEGAGREGARGGERERGRRGHGHGRAHARSPARPAPASPRSRGSSLSQPHRPPTQRLLGAGAERRARPRWQAEVLPGPSPISPLAGGDQEEVGWASAAVRCSFSAPKDSGGFVPRSVRGPISRLI